MTRYKLVIEYDGTDYCGWQKQDDVSTIQGEIEQALRDLNGGQRVVLHGAGRTDSGVHAYAQVAHFDLESEYTAESIQNAINAKTGHDIAILSCQKVDSNFHSRFHAVKRHYTYKIRQRVTALGRKYHWIIFHELDTNLLDKCAELIKGRHNFEGFCKTSDEANSKVCKIHKSVWKSSQKTLTYEICGDRFLHSMVRILTGTMVEVARGRYQYQDFVDIFGRREDRKDIFKAPAKGLFLSKVEYEI